MNSLNGLLIFQWFALPSLGWLPGVFNHLLPTSGTSTLHPAPSLKLLIKMNSVSRLRKDVYPFQVPLLCFVNRYYFSIFSYIFCPVFFSFFGKWSYSIVEYSLVFRAWSNINIIIILVIAALLVKIEKEKEKLGCIFFSGSLLSIYLKRKTRGRIYYNLKYEIKRVMCAVIK